MLPVPMIIARDGVAPQVVGGGKRDLLVLVGEDFLATLPTGHTVLLLLAELSR